MPKYTRKSAEIIAVQVSREAYNTARDKVRNNTHLSKEDRLMLEVSHLSNRGFQLHTQHGLQEVSIGDFIMQKPNGDFAAMGAATFNNLFELVKEEEPQLEFEEDVESKAIIKDEAEIEIEKASTTKKYCN